jgi:hypothetical protein
MDPQIQELLDKKAIEEVLVRYCRTQDWLDEAGQATVFWPDADIDYGFFKGSGADFVPAVMEVEGNALRRWHMGTNIQIKLTGADSAIAESYGIAVGTGEADGELKDNMYGGRYLDELEKRGDEWRISKRVYILDWSTNFANAIQAVVDGGFPLNILQIREPGHDMYREM